MEEKNHITRWPYLLVGAISMLFAGIIYAWSILKGPLSADFGWSAPALALNFTLTLCFFCIGGVLGSILTKKLSIRLALFASAVLVLVGFGLVSFLTADAILMLYIAYGGLCGTGIGMAYNIVISATSAWFPDKKGTCSGVLMMSFGISSLVLGKAASMMFGIEYIGWRRTYLILGVAIAAVLAIAAFLVRVPGAEVALPKPAQKKSAIESFTTRDYTTGEMLRRVTFWGFFLYCILTAAVGSTVISFAQDLAISAGAGVALATTLVGVLSVSNGLGRIICGIIFDILGRRRTMIIANLLAIAAPAILLISIIRGSLFLCIVGLCVTGISYGCCPTITAAFIGAFYGTKSFPTNYSVANLMLIPTSFAATIASAMQDSTGSYIAPFVMLLVFSVCALVVNLNIRKP